MTEYRQLFVKGTKINFDLDPGVIFHYNQDVVEYVYRDPFTYKEKVKQLTLSDINEKTSKKVDKIQTVLYCRESDSPILVIIASDAEKANHIVWYHMDTKKMIDIDSKKAPKGDITAVSITDSPFDVIFKDRQGFYDVRKSSFVMVIGTRENGTTLILLSLHGSRIHVELTEPFRPDENNLKELGHVTAICILPPDKEDKRMGHSDLQILLGYSLGFIFIYRVRVNVYSYKASRLRGPIDISDFVEFPGYPITQLSCARSYNSLLMTIALAQQKPQDASNPYIKIVETKGDSTTRQRTIITPPNSAFILDTTLIPATTTLDDQELQLSIITQTPDDLLSLNVWEVTPEQTAEILLLSTDQQTCIQRMAHETSLRLLQLDTAGYLVHMPQKVADVLLRAHGDGIQRRNGWRRSKRKPTRSDQRPKRQKTALPFDNSRVVIESEINLLQSPEQQESESLSQKKDNWIQATVESQERVELMQEESNETSTSHESTAALEEANETSASPESTALEETNETSASPESTAALEETNEASTSPESTVALEETNETSTSPEPATALEESSEMFMSFEPATTLEETNETSMSPEPASTLEESNATSTSHESTAALEESNEIMSLEPTTTLEETNEASTSPESTVALEESSEMLMSFELATTLEEVDETSISPEPATTISDEDKAHSPKDAPTVQPENEPSMPDIQSTTVATPLATYQPDKPPITEIQPTTDTMASAKETESDHVPLTDTLQNQVSFETPSYDTPPLDEPLEAMYSDESQQLYDTFIYDDQPVMYSEEESHVILSSDEDEIHHMDDGNIAEEGYDVQDFDSDGVAGGDDDDVMDESEPEEARQELVITEEDFEEQQQEDVTEKETMLEFMESDKESFEQQEEEETIPDFVDMTEEDSKKETTPDSTEKDITKEDAVCLVQDKQAETVQTNEEMDSLMEKSLSLDKKPFVYGGQLDEEHQETPTQTESRALNYIPVSDQDLARLAPPPLTHADLLLRSLSALHESRGRDGTPALSVDAPIASFTDTTASASPASTHSVEEPFVAVNTMSDEDRRAQLIHSIIQGCFHTSEIDIDILPVEKMEKMGDYCWQQNEPQPKLFMMQYCQQRGMPEAVVLLGRYLLRSQSIMTIDEIKECKSMLKRCLFRVHPVIRKGAISNPFRAESKSYLQVQKRDYLKQLNGSFSQQYTSYYGFGTKSI